MKRTKTGRRLLAILLTTAMTVTLLAGIPAGDMGEAQASSILSNPRTDSDGVVTYDCVYFGSYPQSDATGQTKEPIKWRVLSVNGNDALLMADTNLDVQRYNDTCEDVTWATCTIRSWLNGYGSSSNVCGTDYSSNNFLDRAFTSAEQSAIIPTTLKTADNVSYETEGGDDTQDRVFLLSCDDMTNVSYGFASDYLTGDKARLRVNTVYVAEGGSLGKHSSLESAGSANTYWTRSPGRNSQCVRAVSFNGTMSLLGSGVNWAYYAVCPVLHLNISSLNPWTYAGTVGSDGSSTELSCSHTYDNGTITAQPDCETQGAKIYTCVKCNAKKTETLPANGHQYNAGVVTKEASYTEKGIKTYTCESCGKIKTEEIPQLVRVKKVKLSGISKKIAAGKKIRLTAKLTPSDASNQTLKWTSSNKKYATVSSTGVVTTKKKGAGKTVTIKAATQDGSKIVASYKIKLVKHAVKSIKLKAKSKTVKAGKKLTIKATVKTTGKTANKTLQWSSSNTKYATVSGKGVVKAKKAGKGKTVKITAWATDGTGKKAVIKIKIK